MVLIAENTLELPRYPAHTAPNSTDNQWFARKPTSPLSEEHWRIWEFERRCVAALVVKGIGQRQCPSRRPWAYACIAGAMIAALSGKRPVIPEGGFGGNIEIILWEALWEATEKSKEKLDRDFLVVMMRSLLPRTSYTPPLSSGVESNFADGWHNLDTGFADTSSRLLCNLRRERIQEGKKAFLLLPEPVQASVLEVAQHVPYMLRITVARIRRTHSL